MPLVRDIIIILLFQELGNNNGYNDVMSFKLYTIFIMPCMQAHTLSIN